MFATLRPGARHLFGVLIAALVVQPAAWAQAAPQQRPHAALTVEVRGFRTAKGQLLVSVFDQEDGFPKEHRKARLTQVVPLKGRGPLRVVFRDLAPGHYAVAVAHDADDSRSLNTGLLGVPKEGFGVSNNVRPTVGAPDFDDARFEHGSTAQVLVIDLIYY